MSEKILIVEDEPAAAARLTKLIQNAMPGAEIIDVLDSVESSVKWLQKFQHPDLIFMDIQLADGISFSIFKVVETKAPIIFTTAFDQYTLKAFKVNSIDYLLKPIDPEELESAVQKFQELRQNFNQINLSVLESIKKTLTGQSYKERFLVKNGKQLKYIPIEEIAYFYAEDGLNFLRTKSNDRYIVELILDEIQNQIDPTDFFRISRKYIIHHKSIESISTYFNSRLSLKLSPSFSEDVIVSRERVSKFKKWLDS